MDDRPVEFDPLDPEYLLGMGEHAGYLRAVVHNGRGTRCGYVRIPEGHPWYHLPVSEIEAWAHGGINWAAGGGGGRWIGFDCEHVGDKRDFSLPIAQELRGYLEGFDRLIPERPGLERVVRSQEYVEAECRGLCEQARSAEGLSGGDR